MSSLGNDLAIIRKQQDLSLEDIHNATKIPIHLLQAIENDTIFTDFEENKTYVRSYIRSYCRLLKLDDELVVEALDKFESGNYSGQLIPGRTREEDVKEISDKDGGESPPETSEIDPPETPIPLRQKEESADQKILHQEHVPNPPSIGSVDWADMGRKFIPLQTRSRMWIGIVIILLLVAAVVMFWYYQNNLGLLGSGSGNASSSQGLSQPAVVPDSLQLRLTEPDDSIMMEESTETMSALGDTLILQIYAAYGNLEPVRVYADIMDDTNPYWIEQREALEFEFVDYIYLRGQYSRMELLFNGHPIENFRQRFFDPDSGMVLIQRSIFEESDMWLQPAPDSTQLNFSPPLIIRERPIFN